MESYCDVQKGLLSQAMRLLTLAFMRLDIVLDAINVKSYKELVNWTMLQVSFGQKVSILDELESEMREKYAMENISKHSHRITF
jgi:hypothetical protein